MYQVVFYTERCIKLGIQLKIVKIPQNKLILHFENTPTFTKKQI